MGNVIFSIFPSRNFIDLNLYQFGWEQCDPSHSFGPAARNHYLFHYVISGTGTLIAQDENGTSHSYPVRSGQGFLIFPKQICTYIADERIPWEYAWMEFDGLRAKELVDLSGLKEGAPIYKAAHKDMAAAMKNEMMYLVTHKDESPYHLIGHLFLALDFFVRSLKTEPVSRKNDLTDYYISEALIFVEQNFQNEITVEDMAAFCGLNRSYFGKIFRERIGKSPQEFLISYRMSKATELLRLTELSISDIGNAVGYSNQLHFSRAFKNVYGLSPRTWRSENRITL